VAVWHCGSCDQQAPARGDAPHPGARADAGTAGVGDASSYRGCPRFERTWPKGGVTTSDNPLDWPKNLLGWESLPASPAAIDRAIIRRFEHGHARDTATFAYAAAFLQENAPPAIRAALYRAIELLPGVRNLGPMTDLLGRRGIGVGLVRSGIRQELIFNPGTSRALQAELVAVGSSRQATTTSLRAPCSGTRYTWPPGW
jgi:hypothetical protein